MAKKEGKPKKRRKPLPDPKERKKCKHEGCAKYAIFLEEYCWKHLPDKAKSRYKEKIEKWVDESRSLEGANLRLANLQRTKLHKANLQEADLSGANLQKANLSEVNLQKVRLNYANLQETNLFAANLRRADLWKADLQRANLQRTNLQETDLQEVNLTGANLSKACLQKVDLDVCKSFIGVSFQNAWLATAKCNSLFTSELRWMDIQEVGDEKGKHWEESEEFYFRLKNHFRQHGRYQDESQAYYREKLMAQRQAWKEKKLGKWFWLFVLNILAGFGEKIERTVISGFGAILLFAGVYWWGTNAGWGKLIHDTAGHIKDFWHCLYFSVVTFATLGFGDIAPAFQSKAAVAAVIEVILGYVFLGMLITIIARRFGR